MSQVERRVGSMKSGTKSGRIEELEQRVEHLEGERDALMRVLGTVSAMTSAGSVAEYLQVVPIGAAHHTSPDVIELGVSADGGLHVDDIVDVTGQS